MAIIKKKAMGKPMKKAQNGRIISEEGDLADALNEYEAMKRKGTVPKGPAAMKQIDKWIKQGKLILNFHQHFFCCHLSLNHILELISLVSR